MVPDVKDKILSRSRAKEMAKWTPSEPSLKEMRRKLGGRGVSDDEMLLRYFAGEDEVAVMQAAPPSRDYVSARSPLVALIGEHTQRTDCHHIYIRKGDLSLYLEKGRDS